MAVIHTHYASDRVAAKDHTLSLKATGLLYRLLAETDGLDMHLEDLRIHLELGQGMFNTGFKELVAAGYILLIKYRINGRHASILEIFESAADADNWVIENQKMLELLAA